MRKTILIFLLAFLGLSFNLNAQTDVEINEDSIKEAKLLALPEVKEFARRVGDTLILKLDNGTTLKYVDYHGYAYYEDENGKKTLDSNDEGKPTWENETYYLSNLSANDSKFSIWHTTDDINKISTTAAMRFSLYSIIVDRKTGALNDNSGVDPEDRIGIREKFEWNGTQWILAKPKPIKRPTQPAKKGAKVVKKPSKKPRNIIWWNPKSRKSRRKE